MLPRGHRVRVVAGHLPRRSLVAVAEGGHIVTFAELRKRQRLTKWRGESEVAQAGAVEGEGVAQRTRVLRFSGFRDKEGSAAARLGSHPYRIQPKAIAKHEKNA